MIKREKRSLGLVQLGVNTATGLSSGVVGAGVSALSAAQAVGAGALTAAKIGAGVAIAKPLAFGLLGKCKNLCLKESVLICSISQMLSTNG